MNNFKRGIDSKKGLDVGMTQIWKDMWFSEMRDLYDEIHSYASEINVTYDWSKMDWETGEFQFCVSDFDNPQGIVIFTLPLTELINGIKKMIEGRMERSAEMAREAAAEDERDRSWKKRYPRYPSSGDGGLWGNHYYDIQKEIKEIRKEKSSWMEIARSYRNKWK